MPSAYYSDLCQAIAKGSQAVMEKYQTPAKFRINLVGVFRFMVSITDTKGPISNYGLSHGKNGLFMEKKIYN